MRIKKSAAGAGAITIGVIFLFFVAFSNWRSGPEDLLDPINSVESSQDSLQVNPRRQTEVSIPPRSVAESTVISGLREPAGTSAEQEVPDDIDFTLIRGVVLGNFGKPIAKERVFLRSLQFSANGNRRSRFESDCQTDSEGRFEFRSKKLSQKSVEFHFKLNRKTIQHQVSCEVERIGDVIDLGEITVPQRNALSLTVRVLDKEERVVPGASVTIVPYGLRYSSVQAVTDENGLCEIEAWDQDVELMISSLVVSSNSAVSCRLLSRRHSGHAEEKNPDGSFISGTERVFYYSGSAAFVELRAVEPDKSNFRTLTILAPDGHVEGNRHVYAIFAYQKDGSLRVVKGLAGCPLPVSIELNIGKYFVQVGLLTRDRIRGGTVVRETCFSLHDNVVLGESEGDVELRPMFVRGTRVQGIVTKAGAPSANRLVSPRLHPKIQVGVYLTKRTNAKGEFVVFLPESGPAELLFTQTVGGVRVIPVDRNSTMIDEFGDRFIDVGTITEDL